MKRKQFTCALIISTIVMTQCSKKETHESKEISMKKAPQFTLPDENGTMHSLSDYKGKKVVLYFYPKDETPTCTAQACDIRDNYKVYQDQGMIVLGVSADTVESHKKFKEHHHLPFPLLADVDRAVAKAYGAVGGITGFMGMSQRKTYLIDEQGNLVKEIDKVNVATQGDDILAGFEKAKR